MAACHGGIKEIDFGTCENPEYHKLGKRSIAFYGLSGTGKSSHTNNAEMLELYLRAFPRFFCMMMLSRLISKISSAVHGNQLYLIRQIAGQWIIRIGNMP
jgi:DNA replication protein DnaC